MHLVLRMAIMAVLCWGSLGSANYFQWTANVGQWSHSANWLDGNVPPISSRDLNIVDIGYLNGNPADVTMSGTSASPTDLFLGSDTVLRCDTGLRIGRNINNMGLITLSGDMRARPADINAPFEKNIQGGGEILLVGGTIDAELAAWTNVDNWIHGYGTFTGSPSGYTVNQHLISADEPLQRLEIEGTFANHGILEAVDFGVLSIQGGREGGLTNSPDGVIRSQLGSVVELTNTAVTGGLLHADGGSFFMNGGELSNTQLMGSIDFTNSVRLQGQINNTGLLLGSDDTAELSVVGDVELIGGGSISASSILGNGLDSSLTNRNNKVFFADLIGIPHLQNDGVIESNGGTIYAVVVNNGILRNVNTSNNPSNAAVDNRRGLIDVEAGNSVSMSVSGGLVHGNAVEGQVKPQISGTYEDVQLEGILIANGNWVGSVVNNADVETSSDLFLYATTNPQAFDLSGSGTLRLNNANLVGAATAVRNTGHRISGTGAIRGRLLGNSGIIEADGGTLEIWQSHPDDPLANEYRNSGTYQALTGSQLRLDVLVNTDDGILHAEFGGTVSAPSVSGGSITGTGNVIVGSLSNVINHASIVGFDAGGVSLSGNIENHGTITSAADTATATVSWPVALSGNGTLKLDNVVYRSFDDQSHIGTIFRNGAHHTIEGSGRLGDPIVSIRSTSSVNYGLIDANGESLSLDLQNAGHQMLNYGTLRASGELVVPILTNQGLIEITGGRLVTTYFVNHIDGILTGEGYISAGRVELSLGTENYGVIAPRTISTNSEIGVLDFSFDLLLHHPGELQISLATDGTSTIHDQLLAHSAGLGGTLSVIAEPGYMPEMYQPLTIVDTQNGVSSTFDELIATSNDPLVSFVATYEPQLVSLTPALTGDANFDGAVDISDYNIWNANKFGEGNWFSGDFNQDGVVDVTDLGIWSQYRGSSVINVVPEPATCSWTVAMLFLSLLLRHSRQRSATSD